MKAIEECSADEILAIMAAKYDGDTDHRAEAKDFDLVELVGEYIAKRSTGLAGPSGWAHAREAIGDAINNEMSFGGSRKRIQDGSPVDKVAEGIINAIYARVAMEIGAMLDVDGKTLEKAAKAVADAARRGDNVKIALDSRSLGAAIQNIADNATPPNRRMLPRTKGD